MPEPADSGLADQYRDASNLNSRICLHERFSINRQGWPEWVFEQLDLPANARVLELGCGPGALWVRNLARVPQGWRVTLTDASSGMLGAARHGLGQAERAFEYAVVDARDIPYREGDFDAVIANHMLYHVPDRARALSEIRRVLKPGGRLYASTVGEAHMRELHDLVARFVSASEQAAWRQTFPRTFTLENGAKQIRRSFPHVELRRYPDALSVTEPEPLVAYVRSEQIWRASPKGDADERVAELRAAIEARIREEGAFRIAKDSGLFIAW